MQCNLLITTVNLTEAVTNVCIAAEMKLVCVCALVTCLLIVYSQTLTNEINGIDTLHVGRTAVKSTIVKISCCQPNK